MDRVSRKRRAAVKDIYPVCSVWGNCPPDVKNKVERTTTADQILKFGSAGIYLGNLGITSSSSTSGTLAADAVLGQAVRMGAREGVLAPDVPVATVGPRDILPVSARVAATQGRPPVRVPEEIPLQTLPIHEVSPQTVETILEDSSSVISGETIAPRVQAPAGNTTSIMEVPSAPAGRHTVSRMQYDNPAFEVSVHTNIEGAETSAQDQVWIHSATGGHFIGEEIPLNTLGPARQEPPLIDESFLDDTIIQEGVGEGPRTSTPSRPPVQRPARGPGSRGPQRKGILKRLFSRRTEQIPVMEDIFLTNPRRLVTFENPAFEASSSLIFEQDLAEVSLAPHFAFNDIIRLGRQVLSEVRGHVRVSRLGRRGTLRTRSGLQIGSDVHYFRDLSSIPPHEAIEMQILGEQSGEASISNPVSSGETMDALDRAISPEVVPSHDDVSQTISVYFGSLSDNPGVPVTDYIAPSRVSGVIVDTPPGVDINFPVPDESVAPSADIPTLPTDIPTILIDPMGTTFYLHPSLLHRRKRRRVHL